MGASAFATGACDFIQKTLDDINDSCQPDGAAACSKDKQTFRKCVKGKLVDESPCRGAKGCYVDGSQVHCDESVSRIGDHCDSQGAACSEDGTAAYVCVDQKIKKEFDCPGPKGCWLADGKRLCDGRRATLNDACGEDTVNAGVCSKDGKAVLTCKSHAWVIDVECDEGKKCNERDDHKLYCE